MARATARAPAWWPTAREHRLAALFGAELYLSDGTPRAEDDEIWPDSDEEDQDWVDGIVERLEAVAQKLSK